MDGVRNAAERPPLQGEDLGTTHWQDARHWVGIYTDLLRFESGVLARVERELHTLMPPAQDAATEDLAILRDQMNWTAARLELWYARLWELHGLVVERDERVVLYQGQSTKLTKREHQLLVFLLDRPHRYISSDQIAAEAWGNSLLSPEEVRSYVYRLREVLGTMQIPVTIVSGRGRGYLVKFQDSESKADQ